MKGFVIFSLLIITTNCISSPSENALYMDGNADYLKLFEPIVDHPQFTIEAWAKMLGPGGGSYEENVIFEQRNLVTVSGGAAVVFYAKNDREDETEMAVRDPFHMVDQVKCRHPHYGEWHHYAAVVAEEEISLYVDGYFIGKTDNHQTGSFSDGIDHTDIGRHFYQDIVAGYFNGYIDDLSIWNYARSSEEINNWMYATIDHNDPEVAAKLLAYWDFNDFYEFYKNHTQYVGVKDLSGNEHHGAFIDNATLKAVEDFADSIIDNPAHPSSWTLFDNYPNPFNLQTTIVFDVGQDSFIRITVLDPQGNVVRTLAESFMNAGLHLTTWDGRNAAGAAASSGLYFCRLEGRTSGSVAGCLQKKMTLVK